MDKKETRRIRLRELIGMRGKPRPIDLVAQQPLGEADRTGGGQAGGLLFAFALATALRAHDAARSKQRIGGSHRCAHARNGRGGETQTAGAATRQVKVYDPRNPRYNDARSLAVGEFITACCPWASWIAPWTS